MPKRGADKMPVKEASEDGKGISVLDLPERQLDLDTDETGSDSGSEQEFSSDDDDEGLAAVNDGEADDDEDQASDDDIRKSVLDLMQGTQAAGALDEAAFQDRRDRTAEAGTSGAQSDSDSSEDERPSRNTGQFPSQKPCAENTSLCHLFSVYFSHHAHQPCELPCKHGLTIMTSSLEGYVQAIKGPLLLMQSAACPCGGTRMRITSAMTGTPKR